MARLNIPRARCSSLLWCHLCLFSRHNYISQDPGVWPDWTYQGPAALLLGQRPTLGLPHVLPEGKEVDDIRDVNDNTSSSIIKLRYRIVLIAKQNENV